jgi:hypothetical protein
MEEYHEFADPFFEGLRTTPPAPGTKDLRLHVLFELHQTSWICVVWEFLFFNNAVLWIGAIVILVVGLVPVIRRRACPVPWPARWDYHAQSIVFAREPLPSAGS